MKTYEIIMDILVFLSGGFLFAKLLDLNIYLIIPLILMFGGLVYYRLKRGENEKPQDRKY